MLTINSSTTKKELLNQLATMASKNGDLDIEVDSLPNFLTTPVAFTIFSYQISNYPRKILWTSKNPVIYGFLRTCKILTFNPKKDSYLSDNLPKNSANFISSTNPSQKRPVLASMDSLSTKKNKSPAYINKSTSLDSRDIALKAQLVPNSKINSNTIPNLKNKPVLDIKTFPTFKDYIPSIIQPKRPIFRAKDLLKNSKYESNLLFDAEINPQNQTNIESKIVLNSKIKKISKEPSFIQNIQKMFQAKDSTKQENLRKEKSQQKVNIVKQSNDKQKLDEKLVYTKSNFEPKTTDLIPKKSNNTEPLNLKQFLNNLESVDALGIKSKDARSKNIYNPEDKQEAQNTLNLSNFDSLQSSQIKNTSTELKEITPKHEQPDLKEKINFQYPVISSNSNFNQKQPTLKKETVAVSPNTQENFQDLDGWIKKIETTRQALNNKKTRNSANNYFNQSFQTTESFKINKTFSVTNWFFASFLLTSLVLMFLTSFPTQVYTLNINRTEEIAKADLNFEKKDFSSTTIPVEISSQTPATAPKPTTISRATGKVEITNNSGNAIFFDSEGIILSSVSNLKYRHIKQSQDPGTFRIPGDGGSVVITIQAVEAGDVYELNQGIVIRRISNLKNASLGSNLFAIVTEKITNKGFSDTEKVVSQEDIDKLSGEIKNQINTTKDQQIQKIQERDASLSNTNWVKNTPLGITFDKQIGETTDKISGEGKTSIQVFYLEKKILENRLKNINSEIAQIGSYKILETSGNFEDKDPTTLRIEYTYLNSAEINKQKVSEAIVNNNHNLDSVKKDLKNDYPYIQNIERTESGFSIPGMPARIEISVQVKK